MINDTDYSKIIDSVEELKSLIESSIYQQTRNYCKVITNYKWDCVRGGYNAQVLITDVFKNKILKLEKYQTKNILFILKNIKGIKKVKISPVYNKKLNTVFAIGLDTKFIK